MSFSLLRLLAGVGLITIAGLVLAGSANAASNDKRALSKFNGTYKGAWKSAGNLPLTLRMPKGKGNGEGTFEATPCDPGDDVSPLKIRITKYKVRRNGRKLISTGTAIWKRADVPALIGPNLSGKLKVIAVLRGKRVSASGNMAAGALGGGLDLDKGGSLPAAVCVEKAFALPGEPVTIADAVLLTPTTTTVTLTVPNSVAVITDLDVALSISGPTNGIAPFNSDYTVTLRHVTTGVEVELFSNVGFNDDGIFVRLDDGAATGIESVPDDADDFPIVGVYKPEAPATLAAFNGVLASGKWELEIIDDSTGLTGRLLNWTLHIK